MLSSISRFIPNLNPLSSQLPSDADAQPLDSPPTPTSRVHSTHPSDVHHSRNPSIMATAETSKRPAVVETVHATPQKSKKKKDTSHTETFMVVRPPPAKNNHPLNLQVQLVPNAARSASERASRPSIELNASRETLPEGATAEVGASLQRSASGRSNRSETDSTYSYGSVSSISSISSSSNGSSGRRIIPLYNLEAHNVLTNCVTDAGTDAKIAKFSKRALEIMGMAMLEPIEVWGRYTWEESLSPDSHGISLRSSPHSSPGRELPPVLEVPSSPPTPAPDKNSSAGVSGNEPAPQKRLFGRLFNKKKDIPNIVPPTPEVTIIAPSPSAPLSAAMIPEPTLQPPILGLQAILQSPSGSVPPHGRPTNYVWVVRKWIKTSGNSWLGGVAGSVGGALGMENADRYLGTEVEVRFEWKRATKESRRKNASSSGRTTHNRRHSSVQIEGSFSEYSQGVQSTQPQNTTSGGSKRFSLQGLNPKKSSPTEELTAPRSSSRAGSPNPPPSFDTMTGTTTEDGEDGAESDPEDSETPWNCTMHIRPPQPSHDLHQEDERPLNGYYGNPPSTATDMTFHTPVPSSTDIRIRIACLAPAPHHPRVVAQIKTPFPLPDILLHQRTAEVKSRVLGREIESREGERRGLVLSAEEIKDVVSCTGLWLIVREGYGGLSKKRKGDGWRLRG